MGCSRSISVILWSKRSTARQGARAHSILPALLLSAIIHRFVHGILTRIDPSLGPVDERDHDGSTIYGSWFDAETAAFNVNERDNCCKIKQIKVFGGVRKCGSNSKLEHKSRVSCTRANETRSCCAKREGPSHVVV